MTYLPLLTKKPKIWNCSPYPPFLVKTFDSSKTKTKMLAPSIFLTTKPYTIFNIIVVWKHCNHPIDHQRVESNQENPSMVSIFHFMEFFFHMLFGGTGLGKYGFVRTLRSEHTQVCSNLKVWTNLILLEPQGLNKLGIYFFFTQTLLAC